MPLELMEKLQLTSNTIFIVCSVVTLILHNNAVQYLVFTCSVHTHTVGAVVVGDGGKFMNFNFMNILLI
jgi:hypothetical protein